MELILIFLIAIFTLVASRNHPVFTFWLLISLYFDPGGYQGGWFQSNIISNLNFTDIIFFLCWIPFLNVKNRKNVLADDKYFNLFYKYVIIFMFYFIIVYGYVVPQINGRGDFLGFIIKSRSYFMAFLLIRPIYFFSLTGKMVLLDIIIYTAVICLTLYFVSLISGLNLIPINTFERYKSSGIIRWSLGSYGLFDWVLNLSFIVLILKHKFKNKRLLYYSGILMAFTIVLTLTRRELIGRVYSVILIIIIIRYLFKDQRKVQFYKIFFPGVILLGLIYLTFPKYLNYAKDEYKSIGNLIKKGLDKEGGVDYRLAGTGDVVLMKKLISDNLFFGVGYARYTYEELAVFRELDNPLAGLYAGGELPYLGSIGKMGIAGLILFLPIYFLFIKISLKLFRILKNNDINIFLKQNSVELIFAIMGLVFIINKFTFNLFNIFVETYNPSSFLVFSIILIFMITSYNNLNKTIQMQAEVLRYQNRH